MDYLGARHIFYVLKALSAIIYISTFIINMRQIETVILACISWNY